MLRSICCTYFAFVLAATLLHTEPLAAQDPVFSQFYGSGVHSYYERDYLESLDSLSQAIDGGTKDPRAYYYRGLSHMRMGNTYAAQADMQKGAALESADVDQFYPVGKSLERVQGSERKQLERYRALARAQARRAQLKRDAVRYEQRRRAEAHVLRSVPVGPPPAPLRPAPEMPAGAVEPPAPAAAAPTATPPAATAPADPNPFDQPAEAPPAADSPFDTTPAAPPAAPPAVPADEEPAAPPAGDNPFDTPDPAMPADAPAADAPESDNPFAPE